MGAPCGCGEAGASCELLNASLSVSPSSYERLGEMTLRFLPLLRRGFHVVSDLSPEMSIIKKIIVSTWCLTCVWSFLNSFHCTFTFRSAFQFILFYIAQCFSYYLVIE